MELGDSTKATKKHGSPELVEAHKLLQSEFEKYRHAELFKSDDVKIRHDNAGSPLTEISNLRHVSSIKLAGDWQLVKGDDSTNARDYYKEMQMVAHPEVCLSSTCRIAGLDDKTAGRFHHILTAEKPQYKLNDDDLYSLKHLLGDKENVDKFAIDHALTEQLSGKRVLIVEGTNKATNEKVLWVALDTDRSGHKVQEIVFSAPAQEYDSQREKMMQAFKTIKWALE